MPFRSIEDAAKLRRLLEATLLLESDLALDALLHHVVEEACSMTGARYGALGVLNDEQTALADFVTVGIRPEEVERIGHLPTGMGVLGLLITDPRPLRLADLGAHPDSSGFPPNHPPMTSFLGVPIRIRDRVYGNLYLTDKVGDPAFTPDDEVLVEALAVAAGIAIENNRLHEQVRAAAVSDDRDRLARDLHDTVIQRIFASGLVLQSIAGTAGDRVAARLVQVVADLDDTIRQIRSSIFELGPVGTRDVGVRAAILSLLRELGPVLGSEVAVRFEGPVDTAITEEVSEHVLATVREAVTNIARHADATEAQVVLRVHNQMCILRVVDNGRGMSDPPPSGGGLGLTNLRRRAEKLGGHLRIETTAGGGTALIWVVPVAE